MSNKKIEVGKFVQIHSYQNWHERHSFNGCRGEVQNIDEENQQVIIFELEVNGKIYCNCRVPLANCSSI